jgi:outer membrane lipoprotein-sorting protein
VRKLVFGFVFIMAGAAVSAQEIVTAENYLSAVSAVYGGFSDYQATISIKNGDSVQSGMLSYKSPSLLRIDFTDPANQVMVFNGNTLTVYLPAYRAVLTQETQGSSGPGLATAKGLTLLRRGYAAAYLSSPDPVPLQGAGDMVIQLRLTRRYSYEGYKQIILSVNPTTKLIRRIEGTTVGGSKVTFDFTNIKTNTSIPDQRFVYDPPANANQYNNFLLRDNK